MYFTNAHKLTITTTCIFLAPIGTFIEIHYEKHVLSRSLSTFLHGRATCTRELKAKNSNHKATSHTCIRIENEVII